MFERLRKVLRQDRAQAGDSALTDAMSVWARQQGFSYARPATGEGFSLTGSLGNRRWKMECGYSSRDYIDGEELRARAELNVTDDASVVIMNRPLKESLEKRAYAIYTDTLQTTVDPNLTEEMRWLAMYPEVDLGHLPASFSARYAVMADKRSQALAWIDTPLAERLMSWPEPAPGAQLPFILMLLRGKVYLRMQYTPADMPTLGHAALIFISACESAIAGLSIDITL
ncbi:hypothetical protein [Polaromonas jejuensis]|uniref:DUF3786 domain-containing protein n=1 Tax=Polaromonas jejuensis TaxID=457502 RepID=A0ABW0QFY6_9BURK|nr:hypothetical protein [Polaromonas jejuensis]